VPAEATIPALVTALSARLGRAATAAEG
jgi:hypothetical protein